MIRFTVPGEPQGKGRPKATARSGHASVYTPKKTRLYENLIADAYKKTHQAPFPRGVMIAMHITAYYSIPKSAPKYKKVAMMTNMQRPTKKPDWDNVAKVVCDALNRLAYHDDKQIVEATVRKLYSDNPRVEITISEIKPEVSNT